MIICAYRQLMAATFRMTSIRSRKGGGDRYWRGRDRDRLVPDWGADWSQTGSRSLRLACTLRVRWCIVVLASKFDFVEELVHCLEAAFYDHTIGIGIVMEMEI